MFRLPQSKFSSGAVLTRDQCTIQLSWQFLVYVNDENVVDIYPMKKKRAVRVKERAMKQKIVENLMKSACCFIFVCCCGCVFKLDIFPPYIYIQTKIIENNRKQTPERISRLLNQYENRKQNNLKLEALAVISTLFLQHIVNCIRIVCMRVCVCVRFTQVPVPVRKRHKQCTYKSRLFNERLR